MPIILIRTVLVYVILLTAMRVMGKRQIGELEVTDLVITLLLSDIATQPIANPEIPLSHAIIPIITLLSLEVFLSFTLSRFPKLKNLASTRPNVLIRDGVPNEKELHKLRISVEELLSELRQQNVTDIREVNYAILEQNGKISVIPKAEYQQPTRKDLKLSVQESGIMHILISEGVVNRHNLDRLGHNEAWLSHRLQKYNCRPKDVFLMTATDNGEIYCVPKADIAKQAAEEST